MDKKMGFKSEEMTFESDISYIVNNNSSIFHMIGEIIDNSLGSLGINISKENIILNSTIEIFFRDRLENGNTLTTLTITDNCGGIEASEENIKNVMRYGKRNENYKEPFFNVFGQGMKHAAIWSGKKFKLLSKKGDSSNVIIKAEWDTKNTSSKQKYFYSDINNVNINFLGHLSEKVDYGTQIIFDEIYKEDGQKYNRSNIKSLYNFIGWRYGKYIDKGLRIFLYYEGSDGKKDEFFDGMEKGIFLIKNTEPRYESFNKYFQYLQKRNQNLNLTKDEYTLFLINNLANKIDNLNLREWLINCINNDKDLVIKDIFDVKYNGINLKFPFEFGICEFSSYINAYKYEQVYGISIYQAHRALEHGPRIKTSHYSVTKPRDFSEQRSTGGGTAVNKRFIGKLNIDDYVSKFYNQNVLTKNKEFFKISDDIFNNFLQFITDKYIKNLLDFLNELKNIQKENTFIKALKRNNAPNDSTFKPIKNISNSNSRSFIKTTNIAQEPSIDFINANLKIINNLSEQEIELELKPIKLDSSIWYDDLIFDVKNIKKIKIPVNLEYYEKYNFFKNDEFKDFLAYICFNDYYENNKDQKDERVKVIKKILKS